MKINAREIVISANPIAIKIPRLLSDVAALNNRIAPASPRNSVAMPWIARSKDGVMEEPSNGTKIPESNAKNTSK